MKKIKCFRGFMLPISMAYILFFTAPLVFAFCVVQVWRLLDSYHYIPKVNDGDNIVLISFATFLSIFYGILAGRVTETVWRQFEEVRSYKEKDDEKSFRSMGNRNIPTVMLIFVGILSISSLIIWVLVNYSNSQIGELVIGILSYIVSIWLLVALELEDPISGIWYIDIPDTWIKQKK